MTATFPSTADLLNDIAEYVQAAKEAKMRNLAEYTARVISEHKTYTISLIKPNSDVKFEEFEVEGFTNAQIILNRYRKIGHAMGLHTISLHLGKERISKINFVTK